MARAARIVTRAAGALLLLFLLLYPASRPYDPDVWFHLAAGRALWADGAYPQMDRFLHTYPAGVPASHHEWLFQALLYPVWRAVGFPGVVLAKCLLVAGAFAALFFASAPRAGFLPALLYLLTAYAAASERFLLRPEVAGAAILAAQWLLLSRPLTVRRAAALVGLQVLWVNLHWSAIVGVAVVGCFAAADALRRAGRLPAGWSAPQIGARRSAAPLLLAATVIATLASPDLFRPLVEPFRFFFPQGFRVPIEEVRGTLGLLLAGRRPPHLAWYAAAVALSLAGFALNRRRVNLAHLLVFCAVLTLSLSAERHLLFFGLLTVPIFNANLAAAWPRPARRRGAPLRLAGAAAAICILGTLCINRVTGVNFLLPYLRPYEPFSWRASPVLWPHAAARFLLEERLPDPIFNNFNSGNFLNWAIAPRRVYINGTLTDRATEEEYAALAARPGGWPAFAERTRVNTVFLRLVPLVAPSRLVGAILAAGGWRLVFYDGTAAVLVRETSPAPAAGLPPAVDLAREFDAAAAAALGDPARDDDLAGLPLLHDLAVFRGRRDQARLFRCRAQFYLLANRPDLTERALAVVAEMER